MKYLLTTAIIFPAVNVEAGWWKNFCEKYIIMEDPYPYYGYTTDQLIVVYRLLPDPAIARELKFRVATGLMSEEYNQKVSDLLSGTPLW